MTPDQINALFNTNSVTEETLRELVRQKYNLGEKARIIIRTRTPGDSALRKKLAELPAGVIYKGACLVVDARESIGGVDELKVSLHGPAAQVLAYMYQPRSEELTCWCFLV